MAVQVSENHLQGVNRFYTFYELSVDMLGVAGFDGYFLELSRSWERVLGFSRDELLSTPYLDFVHPDDRLNTMARAAALTTGEETVSFENRYRGHDGTYRWLEWNATPHPDEELIYFVARDVTERKRMEQAQREAEEELRAAMELLEARAAQFEGQAELLRLIQANIPLCVWAVDSRGIFTHHAGRGLVSARVRDGQHLGKSVYELYPEPADTALVRSAFAGELGHSLSESHGVFWENWYIPMGNHQGKTTGVAGISLDISAARRAEIALRAKLELIERQQQLINALSTPIIEVWDRVLMLPLLGVLDSVRAAEVMENLLARLARTRSRFAILDLTGVEALDTGTAAHLLRLIHAIRLLGAEGVITGIHPNVAQTMVSLGVDLGRIVTLATLRDGLEHCMRMMNELSVPRFRPLAEASAPHSARVSR